MLWKETRLTEITEAINNAQILLIKKPVNSLKDRGFNIIYEDILKNINKQSITGSAAITKAIFNGKYNCQVTYYVFNG